MGKALAAWVAVFAVVVVFGHNERVKAYRSGFDAGVKTTLCATRVAQTGAPSPACEELEPGQREYAMRLGREIAAEVREARP
jgi:hypothetical protein